jgi:Tol biopolymer transport system component
VTDALDRLTAALADRYAIERELGQGGMATVYLARDLKLGRAVALKVLRPELAASLGGERFLREIEIAAKLAHPHILALHDCGEAAGLLYYTMPFVEGESLRDRLTREKQLPLEDALRIARDVADALGYAHALGLVHRDIKPENILFEAGHAVVSDFGIARAVSAAGGAHLTESGLAIGTPAYMSPEQAAGSQDVDGRSDLYSLGCVLYEMLGGDPPFYASTPQAVLAKKLSEPVPRISVVRGTVPAGIEAALNKALARTPADRFATAAQFGAALATTDAQTHRRTDAQRLSAARWRLVGAGVFSVAAVAVVVLQLLRSRPLDIAVSDNRPVTSEPGLEFQPAISPDGNEVAFLAGPIGLPHVVISTLRGAGGGEVRLSDTSLSNEWLPRWSGDGEWVRFYGCPPGRTIIGSREGCAWMETGKLGGAVRPLTAPRPLTGYAWSPDGARAAFIVADTIFASTLADARTRVVAIHRDSIADLHSLAWSPDGTLLAYVSGNFWSQWSGNVAPSSIWVVAADGGEPRRATADDFLNVSPVWLDSRHLLFVSNRDGPRTVYVVAVGRGGRRGEPRAVPGVLDPHSISYSPRAARLAYAKMTVRQNIWSFPLGRGGAVSMRDGRPVTSGTQTVQAHDLSPDGRWIVFGSDRRTNLDIYKMPVGGGDPVSLTDTPGDEFGPRWSPDGSEIAFSTGGRDGDIRVMPAGGGPSVKLTNSPGIDDSPVWSPNGLAIAFRSNRTGRFALWLLTRDSLGAPWHDAVPLADCGGVPVDWVPDGSGVLCENPPEVVLISPQGRALWRRDLAATTQLSAIFPSLRLSPDGRTIYLPANHRDGRRGIWAIRLAGGDSRLVVRNDDPNLINMQFHAVGRDRLYVTIAQPESDIWVMNLRW